MHTIFTLFHRVSFPFPPTDSPSDPISPASLHTAPFPSPKFQKKNLPKCAWHATVLQTIVSASEKEVCKSIRKTDRALCSDKKLDVM